MGGVILSEAKDLGRWREILRFAQDDSLWQLTRFKKPTSESLLPSFQASFKGLFAIYD